MLTALISVCSLATVSNLGDCTRGALDLVYVSARSPAGHLLDACPGLWGRQLDRTRSATERRCQRRPRARSDQQSRQSREPSRLICQPSARPFAVTELDTWAEARTTNVQCRVTLWVAMLYWTCCTMSLKRYLLHRRPHQGNVAQHRAKGIAETTGAVQEQHTDSLDPFFNGRVSTGR
jgi:hypothetical protein